MSGILGTAAQVAAATKGQLFGDGQMPILGVSIDSRQVSAGDLFVALPGERVDGHDFIMAAQQAGAALIISARWPLLGVTVPVVVVADTGRALGDLAAWHRARFTIPVVGITGSVGKTTTKDLTKAVLSRRWLTLANPGNYNTEIGLPLTIFHLSDQHGAAVLEMAMRAPGEIARLAEIARPEIAVITRIGETHLELLGSRQGIAAAKGEILDALPPSGWAVLNGDDHLVRALANRCPCPAIFYGLEKNDVQVWADEVKYRLGGTEFSIYLPGAAPVQVRLPVPGRHIVANALAAAAVGHVLGLSAEEIAAGLSGADLTGMRMEIVPGPVTIINDAYNASPTSVVAALRTLRELTPGRAGAVLGDMLELGPSAPEQHRQVGQAAAEVDLAYLITYGQLALEIGRGAVQAGMDPAQVVHAETRAAAARLVLERCALGDWLLVKGSRGMRMEQIIDRLREAIGP